MLQSTGSQGAGHDWATDRQHMSVWGGRDKVPHAGGLNDRLTVSLSGGQASQRRRGEPALGCAAPGSPLAHECPNPPPLFIRALVIWIRATLLQCEGILMHSAHKSIPKALGLGFQHNSADDKPSPTYHSTHRFKDQHCPVPVTRGWAPGLKLRHGLCCVHREQPHAWLFLAVSDSGSIRAEVLPPWAPTPPPHLQALPNPR